MGLDMYLSGKIYIGNSGYPASTTHLRQEAAALCEKAGLPPSDNIDSIQIEREVGYWRKANQVHSWLVTNCQDGNDDCGHHYVSREQLTELRRICIAVLEGSEMVDAEVTNGYTITDKGRVPITEQGKVIKDPALAERLLPCLPGFFFGSTDYDQWYVADLQSTIAIVNKCLALPAHVDFYYHSSW